MASKSLSRLMGELRPGSPLFRHALRAAVAITAAVALVRHLDLSHALWVPITVLVVMRPSLGGTLNISWRRMAGTLTGVILGVALAYLRLPALAIGGLAFVMLFWMFYFKDRNYILFISFLTAPIVLILSSTFPQLWHSGAERLFDTVLGLGIGLAAAFLVWPNFARKNLRKALGDLVAAQHSHFRELRNAYFSDGPDMEALLSDRIRARTQLEAATEKCNDAAIEPGLVARQRQELMNLVDVFSRIHGTFTAMASIVGRSSGGVRGAIRPELEELMDTIDALYLQLEDYVRTGEETADAPEFKTCFNRFMVGVAQRRVQGAFDGFPLDSRNNASAFIRQIDRIGTGLVQAKNGLKSIRESR
ncbi:MAG TPA: hypothetical protein DHV36_07655 [Desulfobacteraceae bacterium]|nr:hypothetical protein [Desulfobacteraceae bacterium]